MYGLLWYDNIWYYLQVFENLESDGKKKIEILRKSL